MSWIDFESFTIVFIVFSAVLWLMYSERSTWSTVLPYYSQFTLDLLSKLLLFALFNSFELLS